MAQTIGMSLYTGRIRRKRDKPWLQMSSFDGSTDFLDVAKAALQAKLNSFSEIGDKRRKVQVNNDIFVDGRTIDGTLNVGEYGIASKLLDEEGKMAFERQQKHAEMLPLYYRLWCPEGHDHALFALQHYGTHGCKTALERVICDAMQAKYSDFLFVMKEAVSQSIVERYMKEGKIKGLSFTQQGVPSDWATAYDGVAMAADQAEVEVHFKTKGATRFALPPRIAKFFYGPNRNTKGLFELNNFETDELKITVDVNGRDRTLSHKEFFRVTSRLDLDGAVEKDDRGHPKKESIRAIAQKLITDAIQNSAVGV